MSRKGISAIAIFTIVLAAIFLRVWRFEEFITFLGDQGRDASIIYKILTLRHFPAIGAPSSVGGVYLGPFYYYFIAPWLLLFGFNPVGLGYGVAFFSIVGLMYFYFVVKKEVGVSTALLFSGFCAFSYVLIDLSRFSWNPNLLPLFSFLTIHFLYRWYTSPSPRYAVLTGALIALTIQLHYLALVLLVPIGIVKLYELKKTHFIKPYVVNLGIAALAFIFFSSPLILFDLRHQFLNSSNFIKLFSEGKIAAENSYFIRLGTTVSQFWKYVIPVDLSTFASITLFIFCVATFMIYTYRKKSHYVMLHTLAWSLYIVCFALLSSPRHFHYYGPIYLSFYLIVASCVVGIRSFGLRIFMSILVLGLFITLNAPRYSFLYYPPNNQIAYAQSAADSVLPHIRKTPIQLVPIPTTETDGHFRYFLELKGVEILPNDSPIQAEELYVFCFDATCKPLDDPQWQIAAFYNKKIETFWKIKNVTIYKVIHAVQQSKR